MESHTYSSFRLMARAIQRDLAGNIMVLDHITPAVSEKFIVSFDVLRSKMPQRQSLCLLGLTVGICVGCGQGCARRRTLHNNTLDVLCVKILDNVTGPAHSSATLTDVLCVWTTFAILRCQSRSSS